MLASRALLILLLFCYFILPAIISEFIFDNDFYIYSSRQSTANYLSLIYGLIFIVWLYLLFKPRRACFYNRRAIRLANWPGLRIAYFAMCIYSVLVLFYGQQLRAAGASREELLSGIGEFLLPGMGLILLGSAIFAVSKATRFQFYLLFVLFFMIDITYNGKIFSFIALVLFFMRFDFSRPSMRTVIRVFAVWTILGVSFLLVSGFSRIALANDEFNANIIGFAYLLGSEFLGVQATIGWGIDYFSQNYPPTFWLFVSTLEEFYRPTVGHGLGVSPGAFFEANFGGGGLFIAVITCAFWLLAFSFGSRLLGWLSYLIVAINFIHLLRHGIDVFLIKVVSQMIFAFAVSELARPLKSSSVQSEEKVFNSIKL